MPQTPTILLDNEASLSGDSRTNVVNVYWTSIARRRVADFENLIKRAPRLVNKQRIFLSNQTVPCKRTNQIGKLDLYDPVSNWQLLE